MNSFQKTKLKLSGSSEPNHSRPPIPRLQDWTWYSITVNTISLTPEFHFSIVPARKSEFIIHLTLSTSKPLNFLLLTSLWEFTLWTNPSKWSYWTPDKTFAFVGRENFIIGPGLGPSSPHTFRRCFQHVFSIGTWSGWGGHGNQKSRGLLRDHHHSLATDDSA